VVESSRTITRLLFMEMMALTVARSLDCTCYSYLLWLYLGGWEGIMRVDNFLTMLLRQKACKVPSKECSVNLDITNFEK